MKKKLISKAFKNTYLVGGETKANHIFVNCPLDFMNEAYRELVRVETEKTICNIRISRDMEVMLNKLFYMCNSIDEKRKCAKDFVYALVGYKILEKTGVEPITKGNLSFVLSQMFKGDKDKVDFSRDLCPNKQTIETYIGDCDNFEANIFLYDTRNVYVQEALNNFITNGTPYCLKVFSNKELVTELDQERNQIRCPQDYIKIDVREMLEFDKKYGKER